MPNARYSSKIKIIEPDNYIEPKQEESNIALRGQNEIETVPVMLMKSLVVKVKGNVTGEEYIFKGAGSVVNVNKLDIGKLIENDKLRQSCCGSYSSPYFKIL